MSQKKTKKEAIREAHIYFPAEVFTKLQEMAVINRRTMNGEVILAVEDRIKQQNVQQESRP